MASLAFFQPKRKPAEPEAARDSGRDVLNFLDRHQLPASPANYTLIHRYLADPDDLLAKAIDAFLMSGAPLTEDALSELSRPLHPDPAPRAAAGAGAKTDERGELRQQARHLAELTARAASANESFGRGLASDLGDMFQAPEPLIAQVREMIQRTESTEKQLAGALQQIEALREEVEAERGNAGCDALTGLLNRRGIQPQLDAARRGDVVAMLDLDKFKQMNDRHGHAVGDRVLEVVASSLSESLQPFEVARWGGEEFLVILSGLDLQSARDRIEKAGVSLKERRFRLRDSGRRIGGVSFSAGLAKIAEGGLERALVAADEALYAAKEAGRDRIELAPARPTSGS